MASPFNSETTADQIAEACADQIRDKVVLTTGVSPGGLGASFVETIAKHHPKLLVLAGRDAAKTEKTAQAIAAASPGVQTRTLLLDLSSQAQIREAAKQVNAYAESIDVLVNNAAVMASPYTTTVDGLESQFGTNHIGHFLFTNLIIDKILAAGPGARIINITSDGHRLSPVRFDDLDFRHGETYNKWRAYGQAKTANMLFTISLAEKLNPKGILSFSVHPGVIKTNLSQHLSPSDFADLQSLDRTLGTPASFRTTLPYKSLSQGTSTHIFASFHPSLAHPSPPHPTNTYLQDCALVPVEEVYPWARDSVCAGLLWRVSERIVGGF